MTGRPGPPSDIARAALTPGARADLDRFLAVSPQDELILVIDTARHGLVSADFVRNTAPDRLSATQYGLPLALRDADLWVATAPDVPRGAAMILRTDRRLGFDPTRDWDLSVQAAREHGMFPPQVGSVHVTLTHAAPARFFTRPGPVAPRPPGPRRCPPAAPT